MWLKPVQNAAPGAEPVSLAEAKLAARIDLATEDSLITGLIGAARTFVEEWTSTRLITQTVDLRVDAWSALAHLPIAPVQSITSIKYLDVDGVEQTLANTVYELVSDGPEAEIRLKLNQAWPSIRAASDAIRIRAIVGYGDATTVPPLIKLAITQLVVDWYESRGAISNPKFEDMPPRIQFALCNYVNHGA